MTANTISFRLTVHGAQTAEQEFRRFGKALDTSPQCIRAGVESIS